MKAKITVGAALLLTLASGPAGAATLDYILQDLRCLPMTRSVLGDGDCAVEQRSVVVAGSSAMLFYDRLLADAFEKRHHRLKVEVAAGNSIAGLIAVERGSIDVAAVSRDLAPREYRADLLVTTIGRDGLVAVVNKANPLGDLSRDQLRAIFMGEQTQWQGSGRPLHVISREVDSGSLQSFEELALGGEGVVASARRVPSPEAMIAAVAADPDAIGFVGLHGLSPEVKALSIDGVPMNEATILSSRYPLTRSLNLVTEIDAEGAGREFVEFAASPQGQALIEKSGAMRVD
jgi:phosphate transport system substrate-binding protein